MKRAVVLSGAALILAFGAAGCGVAENVQQDVESEVRQEAQEAEDQLRTRADEEVDQLRTQAEDRVQEEMDQLEEQQPAQ